MVMRLVFWALLFVICFGNHAFAAQDVLAVDAQMQACTVNDDCTLVDQACSGCCNYVAINRQSLPAYSKNHADLCKDYKGAVCECYNPKNHPACVDGYCVLQFPPGHVPVQADFGSRVVYTDDAAMDKAPLIEDCMKRGGMFSECGTPCESKDEVCITVCAYTCENIQK